MNDLAVRAATGFGLVAIAIAGTVIGGNIFALMVAAIATLVFFEWTRMVRGWGIGWWVAGFVYALLPALALLWIRERYPQGLDLIVWLFIVTWATDIGGYFVGRKLGRNKLAPRISPNKTVEGLIGGVVFAAALGGAWAYATNLPHLLFMVAPAFAIAAQAGDLFESWMKRRAGVKDSGDWLPGHGGLLDRLDGLIPVALLTAALHLGGLI